MDHLAGEPIKGVLHSTNASSGVEVPIFNQGSVTARTLAIDEYIEVHSIEVINAVGGDTHVYFGTSGTPGTGTTIVRGTDADNSGVLKSIVIRTGLIAQNVWAIAASGAVDVVFNGTIRKSGSIKTRQSYQASLVPGV